MRSALPGESYCWEVRSRDHIVDSTLLGFCNCAAAFSLRVPHARRLVTTGGGREDDIRVGFGSGNGNEHGSKGLQSKLTLIT